MDSQEWVSAINAAFLSGMLDAKRQYLRELKAVQRVTANPSQLDEVIRIWEADVAHLSQSARTGDGNG